MHAWTLEVCRNEAAETVQWAHFFLLFATLAFDEFAAALLAAADAPVRITRRGLHLVARFVLAS